MNSLATHSTMHAPVQTHFPKLVLSSFDGDPLLFHSFWDNFKGTVHKNQSLDDVSKFNYLKGLLEGEAKACIFGLAATAENYKHAIELLHERFGDPQTVISSHMATLLNLRPVLYDDVRNFGNCTTCWNSTYET